MQTLIIWLLQTSELQTTNVQYSTQRLVIGYDALLDYNNGKLVYKRYGQNSIINYRIKAWDTNDVDSTGEQDEK